jgi:hypothetical protein
MKNVKKILVLCLVMFSFLAADAQKRKGKKHSKKPNKEAIAIAKFNKNEKAKKLLRDSLIIKMKLEDSTRLALDSIADFQNDSTRVAYRDSGNAAIDSFNTAQYASMGQQRNQWDKTDRFHNDISHTVKLNDYKTKQVKYINQTYAEKAKLLTADGDMQSKATELALLNEERRKQIKAVVGKGKEKKLERGRKSYVKKNGTDADMEWINVAETVAKK